KGRTEAITYYFGVVRSATQTTSNSRRLTLAVNWSPRKFQAFSLRRWNSRRRRTPPIGALDKFLIRPAFPLFCWIAISSPTLSEATTIWWESITAEPDTRSQHTCFDADAGGLYLLDGPARRLQWTLAYPG